MATITTIADDFDGSTPAETVTFSVSGKDYAIDLNEEHRAELEALLAEVEEKMSVYTAKARPLGSASRGRTSGRSSGAKSSSGYDAKEVREWAGANGYEVSPRGRIPREIVDAFNARNSRGK